MDWKPKDPHAPDGLAMLGGHITQLPIAEQICNVFLGTSIGAMTDIGKTDDQIIELCKTILARVRAAKANPEAMARFEEAARGL